MARHSVSAYLKSRACRHRQLQKAEPPRAVSRQPTSRSSRKRSTVRFDCEIAGLTGPRSFWRAATGAADLFDISGSSLLRTGRRDATRKSIDATEKLIAEMEVSGPTPGLIAPWIDRFGVEIARRELARIPPPYK